MSSFATGFATGFFNKLAGNIDQRSADAREYFNKQVEVARTVGLENRQRSRAAADESISIAKRLQEMGVPKDIIMAQASMNPAGLGDFFSQVEKLRLEANVPVDEDFFRSVYKLSGSFKAPDEDFTTFFTRMYEPIVTAATTDPEGFKQDKEGSIFAAAFGLNAMDKARRKLATTEVAPGLTAEQAIAMGDTPKPNVSGEAFVTVDPVALKRAAGNSTLTPTVMAQVRVEFESILDTTATGLASDYDLEDPTQAQDLNTAATKLAYEKMVELYAGNEDYLSYIRQRYDLDEEGNTIETTTPAPEATGEPVEAPVVTVPTEGSQERVEAPVAPPTASTDVLDMQEIARMEAFGAQDVTNNGDGTVTYTTPDGQTVTSSVEELRKYMSN